MRSFFSQLLWPYRCMQIRKHDPFLVDADKIKRSALDERRRSNEIMKEAVANIDPYRYKVAEKDFAKDDTMLTQFGAKKEEVEKIRKKINSDIERAKAGTYMTKNKTKNITHP
ncbi:unnamed protein product [Arabis nemorensis]|uniref:Uncharacterized protein n=1 Tax=Arabis nemorensis TaxID=586526 RepID=A0A565C974_9BRAS|nr:unnamed protein product [Arabis nemorensis]